MNKFKKGDKVRVVDYIDMGGASVIAEASDELTEAIEKRIVGKVVKVGRTGRYIYKVELPTYATDFKEEELAPAKIDNWKEIIGEN